MPVLTFAGAPLLWMRLDGGVPAIVLVHGGMCDGGDWARLAPLLAPRHAVIVPDLRAHGASGGDPAELSVRGLAADLAALLRHLDEGPAVLVGHSLGARVVAQATCDAPDLVAGVVLLDGSRVVGGYAASAPAAGVPAPPATLAQAIDATIGPHADAAVRAAIARTMSAASPALAAACVRALEAWDAADADSGMHGAGAKPLLAIQSTYHDRFTPRRSLAAGERTTPYLRFLREAAPDARIETMAGTGHFAMLERPDAVAALILDFAASLERTP